MKPQKKKERELLALFLKKVKRDDLPKRDISNFLSIKKKHKQLDDEFEKLEHQFAKGRAPLYKAKLAALGIRPEDFLKILKNEEKATKGFQKVFGEEYMNYMWREIAPSSDLQVKFPPVQDPFCMDIVVRVCKQRVCVEQRVPIGVDDIWLEAGSDASFTKQSSNQFRAEDSVMGSSSWNWTYHRHSQTHEGQIGIWCSTEFVEEAKILGLGIIFEHLLKPNGWPEANGGCAHGKDPLGLPPSWGRAKMYYKIKARYKKPGEGWTIWFDGAEINYHDTGEVESNIMCWVDNVLGEGGRKDLSVIRYGEFPAGTQILIEAYLSYWAKAVGVEGSASVHYNLSISPYIKIEACSYQNPEWITIHVPDYLP